MRRLIICTFLLSLPAWGAWIEIESMKAYEKRPERGLKLAGLPSLQKGKLSLPAWGRGLKWVLRYVILIRKVAPHVRSHFLRHIQNLTNLPDSMLAAQYLKFC